MNFLKSKIKHRSSFHSHFLCLLGRGNSLVEYALPLAIVAVGIVIGLVSFSSSLQGAVKGSFNASQGNGADERTLTLRPIGSNPYTGSVTLTLKDGSQVQLTDMPRDLKGLVETLGPNGATDLLANAIQNLAKALLAAGKITPDEANQLSKLSNHGHQLAFSSGELLDLAQSSGGSSSVFLEKSKAILIERNASSRNIKDLDPQVIAFFGLQTQNSDYLRDSNGKYQYVNGDIKGNLVRQSSPLRDAQIGLDQFNFYNSFATVMKSSLYQEPTVKAVLDSLVGNVHILSNVSLTYANRATDESYSVSPDKLSSIVADSIHRDSGNICAVGGGKDSGISCPGQK